MVDKKIDFDEVIWETIDVGIRSKSIEKNGKTFCILELSKGLLHPDWCVNGHIGYVISGELELKFADGIIDYSAGDALFIADGDKEKHIPKPISEKVLLFLVEDI